MTTEEAIEDLKVLQDMACTMMFVDSESVSEAIKALKVCQRLEAYVKAVEAAKADFVNIAILKAILGEEK